MSAIRDSEKRHPSAPRIHPLTPAEWDDRVLDALGAFPSIRDFVLTGWKAGDRNTPGVGILGSLARHPPLAKAFLTLSAHVCAANVLPDRMRELAILRISWLRRAEYEFAHHSRMARHIGLSESDLERVRQGPYATGWSDGDRAIIRAVDELHDHSRINQATWMLLAERYSSEQLLDFVFVVGCYDMLALVHNSFNILPEPGVASDDPSVRAHFDREEVFAG